MYQLIISKEGGQKLNDRDEGKINLAKRQAVLALVFSGVGLLFELVLVFKVASELDSFNVPGFVILLIFCVPSVLLLTSGTLLGIIAGRTLTPADRPYHLIAKACLVVFLVAVAIAFGVPTY